MTIKKRVGQRLYYYDGGGHWGSNDGEIVEVTPEFIRIRWVRRNVREKQWTDTYTHETFDNMVAEDYFELPVNHETDSEEGRNG